MLRVTPVNGSLSDSPDYCVKHFNAASQHRLPSVRWGDPRLATRDSAASSVVNQSHTSGPRLFRRLGILSRGSYVKGVMETHGNTGDSVAETFLIFASEHQRRTETFLTLSQLVLPPLPDLRRLLPPAPMLQPPWGRIINMPLFAAVSLAGKQFR